MNLCTERVPDVSAGLNTGSMLWRNSWWSRALLAELCTHAHREDLEAMRRVRWHSSPCLVGNAAW